MAETARPPAWQSKLFKVEGPAGILALVITGLVGAAGAGGVGIATRSGDLSAMDERVDDRVDARVDYRVDQRIDARLDAATNQLRREIEASDAAAESLALARYDEILRRLDRIERGLDGGGR
jgi:hypothetical protein